MRNYLTNEFRAKHPDEPARLYTDMNIFSSMVKAPQQQNSTDCGLFLMQYVKQFFKEPINDFSFPIKGRENWFKVGTVSRKREKIANLISRLATKSSTTDAVTLPEIEFNTKDNAFADSVDLPTEEDSKDLS